MQQWFSRISHQKQATHLPQLDFHSRLHNSAALPVIPTSIPCISSTFNTVFQHEQLPGGALGPLESGTTFGQFHRNGKCPILTSHNSKKEILTIVPSASPEPSPRSEQCKIPCNNDFTGKNPTVQKPAKFRRRRSKGLEADRKNARAKPSRESKASRISEQAVKKKLLRRRPSGVNSQVWESVGRAKEAHKLPCVSTTRGHATPNRHSGGRLRAGIVGCFVVARGRSRRELGEEKKVCSRTHGNRWSLF